MELEQATSSSHSLAETKVLEGKKRNLVVIMVGPPGSGKSTFCEAILSNAKRSWVRICQDTISNGKAGTRAQCLKAATEALNSGKSVLIDRCNLEKSQRVDFVNLTGAQNEIHAVVLDLPAQLCISRSVTRLGHEGNLQGGRAAQVVNKMLKNREIPELDEGFKRITFCSNDSEVKEAINVYSNLGVYDDISSGVFGKKSKDKIVQSNIMKFFKKSSSSSVETEKKKEGKIENNSNSVETEKKKEGKIENNSNSVETEKKKEGKIGNNSSLNESEFYTLAFPSISTSDFQFDLEKASDIIVDSVHDFLKKLDNNNNHKNVRLVLVDLSEKSQIISLVKSKAEKKGIDSRGFFTFIGDITQLYSKGGLKCTAIANAANWRLNPGGGGVNAAIFKAAGNGFETAGKQLTESLNPGTALPVSLPLDSPLYQREKVSHVIHVLGPNMNPQRPKCLQNDYVKGCEVLRNAYGSLFETFVGVVSGIDSGGKEDFGRSKKQKVLDLGNERIVRKERKWDSWALALYNMALNPEKHKNILLEISDDFVVLNDLYPKAKKHVLVLSRLNGLDCLEDLKRENLPLLKSIHSAGIKWAEKFLSEDPSLSFRLGYHSVPSMRQLHLHVISQDFDSACLKNKKHWNSFNSAFFRDSADVINEIENNGFVKLNGEEEKLLAMELRCNRCKSAHPNIPKLKAHIAICRAEFPLSLVKSGRIVSVCE
ncbi:hypothetical protein LUZ60_013073 [Juncus effusus]|nr:hypothetical protein LUZ60_013073 [Juncus effusus]